ncbi:MAG: hypothetical protein JKX92_10785 [Porticoccaceae bacterium]|nr:hypothetical protein [Porticoccaceae bacterium]
MPDSGLMCNLNVWALNTRPALTGDLIWVKEDVGERYKSLLSLTRTSNSLLLQVDCEGKGVFEYTPEGIGIYWEPGGTGPEHYFQALGMSLWLELQGVLCIHANTLAVGDFAIGMIAPSRAGKTTLTAALLQRGMQLMTDDMLALHPSSGEWKVYPGWPQLRMWPDSAEEFSANGLKIQERVHGRFEKRVVDVAIENSFCKQSRPLEHLFLLEMRDVEKGMAPGEVEFTDVLPSEAMIHLLQNSILGDAYQPLGIELVRLQTLAELLDQVPLKKLSYPRGMENLPWVCEQIKKELI